MIPRYTRPEMDAIWSDQHKYECWLKVELAASEGFSELGEVPREAAQALRSLAAFDLKRQLRNVNKIFARVFPEIEGEATRGKPKPKPKAAARRRS